MELIVNIKKKLPGFTLDVNFHTGRDVMGLLGASGSGKSMTLRCIAGIEKPDEGRIVLNNRVLYDSEKGINIPSRQRKAGYLFQNYALFPNMTVSENIGFALDKLTKKQKSLVIKEKIRMMKLEGMEGRYPSQLSGGQQQRVALARALAIEPGVLLLDEPFSALDEHLRSILTKEILDTLSDYGGVTLFVTHNMEEAYRMCNQLVVLKNGHVEAAGNKELIFKEPPTMATAQLTGCKNFSDARYISEHKLRAVEWGVDLTVDKALTEGLKHVGIRAHYIKNAMEDKDNIFECRPVFISETPFRVTVYLVIGNISNSGYFHLQWDISKEEWLYLKERPSPWKICLDPVNLIPLYD